MCYYIHKVMLWHFVITNIAFSSYTFYQDKSMLTGDGLDHGSSSYFPQPSTVVAVHEMRREGHLLQMKIRPLSGTQYTFIFIGNNERPQWGEYVLNSQIARRYLK